MCNFQISRFNRYCIYFLGLLQIKHPRLGGVNNMNLYFYINLFSHSFGNCKSKVRVSAELASSDPSLLGLQVTSLSLCLPVAFLLRLSVSFSPLLIRTYLYWKRVAVMTSFYLNYLFKTSSSNTVTCWGQDFNM